MCDLCQQPDGPDECEDEYIESLGEVLLTLGLSMTLLMVVIFSMVFFCSVLDYFWAGAVGP